MGEARRRALEKPVPGGPGALVGPAGVSLKFHKLRFLPLVLYRGVTFHNSMRKDDLQLSWLTLP